MTRTLKTLTLAALAVACGAPEDADQLAAHEVAATASALCTDAGAANHSAPIGSPGTEVSTTSPDTGYGSAACQGRFVVEATNTAGKSLHLAAGFGDVPQSQSTCASTRVCAIAYGTRLKINPPPKRPSIVWEQIGPEKSAFGQWVNFFGGPYYCSLPTGAGAVAWDVGGPYIKVRVAARAEMPFFGGPGLPQRVSATVSNPEIPE